MGLEERADARKLEPGSLVAARWHEDYMFGFVNGEEPSDPYSNETLAKADHVVLLMAPDVVDAMLHEVTSRLFSTFRSYLPGVSAGDFPPDSAYHLEVAVRDAWLTWLKNYPVRDA